MNLTHRYIKTNGITLHVVESGPTTGPLLILLHGFPDFWYGWRYQIPALAKAGFHVIVPDQRGYNLSSKPRGVKAYHLELLAKDIMGLISYYGESKARVVGHDWGGAVTWWLGHKYPEWIERMTILNVPHPWVIEKRFLTSHKQRMMSWHFMGFQIPIFPELSVHLDRGKFLADSIKRSARIGTFTDEELSLYKKAWLRPYAMTAMLNWYRAMLIYRPQQPINHRISVPTQLIWGCLDKFLGREMAKPSIDMCDNGQLTLIEEATHWVQHEESELVNHLLIDFMT